MGGTKMTGIKVTQAERDEMVRLYRSGKTPLQIIAITGRGESSVYTILKREGVYRNASVVTAEEKLQFMDLYVRKKKQFIEISRITGRDVTAIKDYLKSVGLYENGLPARKAYQPGDQAGENLILEFMGVKRYRVRHSPCGQEGVTTQPILKKGGTFAVSQDYRIQPVQLYLEGGAEDYILRLSL